MTTVIIKHNPFLIETEISIDGTAIVETSSLFKYVKTPMQDWVSEFLPALIEHCNDDELEITFVGLQANYEDLEAELDSFLKNNREYDIELIFDARKSQLARLGAIDTIVDEINNQSLLSELHSSEYADIFSNGKKDEFRIVLLGGNDNQRLKLFQELLETNIPDINPEHGICCIEDMTVKEVTHVITNDHFNEYKLDIPFINGKYCQLKFFEIPDLNTCQNAYYRFAKKAITSEDKPMILCIVDENNKKNDAEIFNLISDTYRIRGKRNKNRFMFIAEDPQYAKRQLNSEFAIKNVSLYGLDDSRLIQKKIEEYQNEVYLVQHVTKQINKIQTTLDTLKREISTQAELNKDLKNIDELKQKALELIESCSMQFKYSRMLEKEIDYFFTELQAAFATKCFKQLMYSFGTKLLTLNQNALNDFVQTLPSEIDKFLYAHARESFYQTKTEIPDDIIEVLKQLGCNNAIKTLAEKNNEKIGHLSPSTYPSTSKYLADIANMETKINPSSFPEFINLALLCQVTHPDNLPADTYLYYDGIKILCYQNKDIGDNAVKTCKRKFKTQIERIRPILTQYSNDCTDILEEKETSILLKFENQKEDIKQEIEEKAKELQDAAQISATEQKRLDYILTLQTQLKELILL